MLIYLFKLIYFLFIVYIAYFCTLSGLFALAMLQNCSNHENKTFLLTQCARERARVCVYVTRSGSASAMISALCWKHGVQHSSFYIVLHRFSHSYVPLRARRGRSWWVVCISVWFVKCFTQSSWLYSWL